MFARFWTMHHSFNIENVGKFFVRIKRRVDWLYRLYALRWVHMLTLLFKARLFIQVAEVYVGIVATEIVRSESAATHVFVQLGHISLAWDCTRLISSFRWGIPHDFLGLLKLFWVGSWLHVHALFPQLARLFWSLYCYFFSAYISLTGNFRWVHSKLFLVLSFQLFCLLHHFFELWLYHFLLNYLSFQFHYFFLLFKLSFYHSFFYLLFWLTLLHKTWGLIINIARNLEFLGLFSKSISKHIIKISRWESLTFN